MEAITHFINFVLSYHLIHLGIYFNVLLIFTINILETTQILPPPPKKGQKKNDTSWLRHMSVSSSVAGHSGW